MNTVKTISWMFLATAMACEKEPTDFAGISMLAGAINHAVPTQKELQTSIKWLSVNSLLVKKGHRYILTEKGAELFTNAKRRSNTISTVWADLEIALQNMGL